MRSILIVGAGKLGYHLAAQLGASGYDVTVMDRDVAACERIARELKAIAIHGDGTEIEALGEADAGHVDYVVAATGKDEDNLAICRIAKSAYACPRVIARVIDPRNEALYRMSGADAVIDPTTIAATRIRESLPIASMRLLSIFESSELSLAEIQARKGSQAIGKSVAALDLPKECVLIAVVRAGKVSIVRGATTIEEGDNVYALASPVTIEPLHLLLAGEPR
jgi:trk system potassium uptake protein TrkA